MSKFRITIIVEPDEDGFYAHCPGLPGVHAGGDTKEEALENARDAAIGILRAKLQHGDPIEENPDLEMVADSEEEISLEVDSRKLLVQV